MKCKVKGCGKPFRKGASMSAHLRWHRESDSGISRSEIQKKARREVQPTEDLPLNGHTETHRALQARRDALALELQAVDTALLVVGDLK